MITREEARAIAWEKIKPTSPHDMLVQIMDELTIEREGCWVFFYQSAAYLASGNLKDMAYGNAPVLVRKSDGKIFGTGTRHNVEFYIQNFEECGDTKPWG